MVVMIAGYDTTAQTMSWMAYEMAKQPGAIYIKQKYSVKIMQSHS